ncbi:MULTISPECIES: DNA helicase PcrA [Clostridium]|uniref:ATP-dependent DNA helicase n=3 Tax=Clostridium TaxID=1485 RepID=D8GTR1_CLOLD|nr:MULTISPECIES: DNA helicase PcrA [Clostridium]ADK16724.1 ATP-dependent DNA helicase [Clostridium ljungdahlii DSM 13528]AGY75782.1 DNA helicase PcrA [Clostridium autoethanogenum DSM 10061]ALU35947.1 ATP-dependent DNA helicase PcrA [Clostridium autoethanogenum DSM 10061]OAA89400.1 ATP-dependent DNA helicase PcrA [Clostridium ljungdahlii DSM 13528]OVY51995.1 ATP-dependent DNA helicase PcrA [Clostridium autoethanogenum]
MDLKSLLNKEQYEAAVYVDGPLLILAGAGSGKTRVLTYRIAHMIKDMNIYPSKILAITFTNKAAGEMKDRIKELVGDEVDGMWVSTFHSSCVRILRREIDKLGYNKNFAIYDSYDQKVLIKQCMKELNISDKDITDREIINKISGQKDNLISPHQFKKENEGNFRMNKIADVYLLYQKKLKDNNALDFDDLIYKTVQLFKENEDILEFYQRKFKYIMVDEYQDTNRSQYEFVRLLAKAHKNICVVGDDDQCIYAWRGADIKNILDFEKDYPNAKVIKLEQNYRSKGNILKAANDVISNNSNRKEKMLRTESENGDKIKLYRAYSDIDEGRYIASKIKEILKEDEGKQYKDFAILYRTNAQSRIFEDVFMKSNIPYRIIGGLKFYDRKEIKDIMAYLKFINNPLDDVSLRRIINVPKRSIGDSTVQKIQDFANSMNESMYNVLLSIDEVLNLTKRNINCINKFVSLINSFIRSRDKITVSSLIKEILDTTGYLEELKDSNEADSISRVENLQELVSAAAEFETSSEDPSLSAFLEKVTLVSDVDNFDQDADSVVLMTVHSAKGLEFPVVFMAGMENGIFPGTQSLNEFKEMEESRRLCYVGITRAKEKLYMTSAETRRVFGRMVSYQQSSFISEISHDLIEYDSLKKSNFTSSINKQLNKNTFSWGKKVHQSSLIENPVSPSVENVPKGNYLKLENIKEGTKVKHGKFGLGTIVSISKSGSDIKLTIVFDKMGIKNLMYGVAPLEAV